uniref:NAC domain-containing protein n=1 Tax=Rhizophora mucronata TaxID=61149 RepID=A0A2P2MZL9_RHIMU
MEERASFAVNGWLKLPIGFRFHPTDEELLVHYLKRKVLGLPLPASVIPEWDVFQTDPWSLPGDGMEKRYFFRKEKGDERQLKCRRTSSGCGYWKPIGKDKQILTSASNQPIGVRKTLAFCNTKHSNKTKATQWVMHEYRFAGSLATISSPIQGSGTKLENWVAYRIFLRKIRPRKLVIISKSSNIDTAQRADDVTLRPGGADFMIEEASFFTAGLPQPSSPCCSGITEISADGSDQEENRSFH